MRRKRVHDLKPGDQIILRSARNTRALTIESMQSANGKGGCCELRFKEVGGKLDRDYNQTVEVKI